MTTVDKKVKWIVLATCLLAVMVSHAASETPASPTPEGVDHAKQALASFWKQVNIVTDNKIPRELQKSYDDAVTQLAVVYDQTTADKNPSADKVESEVKPILEKLQLNVNKNLNADQRAELKRRTG